MSPRLQLCAAALLALPRADRLLARHDRFKRLYPTLRESFPALA